MNLVYILNSQKNLAVIQSASFNQEPGIVNSNSPIAFCFSDQYLVYKPSLSEDDIPLIDVQETLSAHIKKGLIDSSAMDLLR